MGAHTVPDEHQGEMSVMSQRQEQEEREQKNSNQYEDHGNEALQFLDLELSKMLLGEAGKLAFDAYRKILIEKLEVKLKEKLGVEIDALAELAADDFIEDMRTNLEIEARINARAEIRKKQTRKLEEIFGQVQKSLEDEDKS